VEDARIALQHSLGLGGAAFVTMYRGVAEICTPSMPFRAWRSISRIVWIQTADRGSHAAAAVSSRKVPRTIERIAHQARGFAEAETWDREQVAALSLDERLRIAETLRRRVYGDDAPDVRESDRRK